MRSPPGSSHEPSSEEGTLLFVKLCQMPAGERDEVRIDTRDPARWTRDDGRERCPLFASAYENVRLERLRPGQALLLGRVQGAELLALEGELAVEGSCCPARSWIRVPAGEDPEVSAGSRGATLYVKTGHLSAAISPVSDA